MTRRLSQKAAVDRWLRSLRESGDIALVDEALVASVRGLAMAVDEDPSNAALWREYRQVCDAVREAAAGGADDDTATFRISVQAPRGRATVGDTSDV